MFVIAPAVLLMHIDAREHVAKTAITTQIQWTTKSDESSRLQAGNDDGGVIRTIHNPAVVQLGTVDPPFSLTSLAIPSKLLEQ